MRVLSEREVAQRKSFVDAAISQALASPCEKSKRGVVIVKYTRIIAEGYNGPPPGFDCEKEVCYDQCATYAMHAEQRAISHAYKSGNQSLEGTVMYHVRVKGAEVDTVTDGPSCVDCSKWVLEAGIAEFVLREREGYVEYSAMEFHKASLEGAARKALVDKTLRAGLRVLIEPLVGYGK